ncbi:MAG: ABC transporter ATP-binding protein [Flavobacteriales bacterium]
MATAPVFSIRDLDLGYDPGNTVLHIPQLTVIPGELTFVLGPSGAGKSTLLESLGLMKNTFQPGPNSLLDLRTVQGNTTSLLGIWEDGGDRANAMRKKHFSFIFQSTNLMPNFSLGENICFTGMLEGADLSAMKPKALQLMDQLNLDPALFDQPATMASGGQRQRAAFVRALCKGFDVLFCDEPTGNLDHENALSLFQLLRKHIKDNQLTAVIVTHDVDLAERFADHVVKIELQSRNKQTLGVVQP